MKVNQKIIELLERYNLKMDDLDKLIKINKINDNSVYINKIKSVLKKLEIKVNFGIIILIKLFSL